MDGASVDPAKAPEHSRREDDPNNFKKARIAGRVFLAFSVEDFKACDLPLAVAVALKDLADEVKEGKFILWM